MGKLLDSLNAEEFDQIMSQFIKAEDPDAMSLEELDEAVRQRLAEAATTTREDPFTTGFIISEDKW